MMSLQTSCLGGRSASRPRGTARPLPHAVGRQRFLAPGGCAVGV